MIGHLRTKAVVRDDIEDSDNDDNTVEGIGAEEQALESTQQQRQCEQQETVRQFLLAVQQAPDIVQATDLADEITDPPETVPNGPEIEDVNWHREFHPDSNSNITRITSINPNLPDITLSNGRIGCSAYVDHLSSYDALIDKLLGDELVEFKTLRESDDMQLRHLCRNVLLPMDTRVLHCLVRGDLSYQYRNDLEIKKLMDKLWVSQRQPLANSMGPVQPSIYIQYIVDKNGRGLTAVQRMALTARLREYCNNTNHGYAFRVDTQRRTLRWSTEASYKGHRKYLSQSADQPPIERRQRWILEFCDSLERHTRTHSQCEAFPLREVGYTNRAHQRLMEHRCHRSSNFIMNVVEAICDIEFPDKFHLDQYVVAALFAPPQASVAEILLTRLADGYIKSGVGMSFWNAGVSNSSAAKFSFKQILDFNYHAMTNSPFDHNAEWEHLRRQAELQDAKKLMEDYEINVKILAFLEAAAKQEEDEAAAQKAEEDAKKELIDTVLGVAVFCNRMYALAATIDCPVNQSPVEADCAKTTATECFVPGNFFSSDSLGEDE